MGKEGRHAQVQAKRTIEALCCAAVIAYTPLLLFYHKASKRLKATETFPDFKYSRMIAKRGRGDLPHEPIEVVPQWAWILEI